MPNLMPCPFCGCEDIRTPTMGYNQVKIPQCNSCKAEAPSPEAWNHRTPPPATKEHLRDLMESAPPGAIDDLTYKAGYIYSVTYTLGELRKILAEWPGPAKEDDGPQSGTIRRSALAIQRATPDELRGTLERSERAKEES